ncbi:MAG TPA: type II toxin-antitoxin system HicB family antitoxin, partial [Rhodocyclaceae bacterium]|nr:type II toxin-antitoxin system HicB family antitoxin [Rhodocyclaceae bacterium]
RSGGDRFTCRNLDRRWGRVGGGRCAGRTVFDPAEKIDITLPRLLLAKIDEYAKAHDVTRSGFLAEAARSAMR